MELKYSELTDKVYIQNGTSEKQDVTKDFINLSKRFFEPFTVRILPEVDRHLYIMSFTGDKEGLERAIKYLEGKLKEI